MGPKRIGLDLLNMLVKMTEEIDCRASQTGKATVCGVGRSKCEPGALPKVADCGLGPQDLQYNMVYVGEAFGKLSLFEADGPYKLLYHKERLATWQICKAVLF